MGHGPTKPEALEALCRELVDEALAPLGLPAELEAAVRACLEDELLLDADARLLLRRALGDPTLDHSGEVASLDDDAALGLDAEIAGPGGGKEEAG